MVSGLSAEAQGTASSTPVAGAGQTNAAPAAVALEALRDGRLKVAEMKLAEIENPAAQLYVKACIEQAKGDPKRAIQTVAQAIVRYPIDPDWTAQSELMSAALYKELGLTHAANVTLRQVQALYQGTAVAEKAAAMQREIEQLKK